MTDPANSDAAQGSSNMRSQPPVTNLQSGLDSTVNSDAAHEHQPIPMREWAEGMAWGVLMLIGKLPLCRVGLHDDCGCCSPGYCTRCGAQCADEARPGLARHKARWLRD